MDKELKEYIDKKVEFIVLVILESTCGILAFIMLVLMNMTPIDKLVYWVYVAGDVVFLGLAAICSYKRHKIINRSK